MIIRRGKGFGVETGTVGVHLSQQVILIDTKTVATVPLLSLSLCEPT